MQQCRTVERLCQDSQVITTLRTLDNPYTRQATSELWNKSLSKVGRPEQARAVVFLSEILYWVYSDKDFKMDLIDLTLHRWYDQNLFRHRQTVFAKVEQQLLVRLKMKQGQVQQVVDTSKALPYFPAETLSCQEQQASLEQLQRFFAKT